MLNVFKRFYKKSTPSYAVAQTAHLKKRGLVGEQAAMTYLRSRGFTIKAHSFRVRYGEIDIIAQQGALLIFVEVKTRSTQAFLFSEIITPKKQERMVRAAQHYCVANKLSLDAHILRFDIALVACIDEVYSLDRYIENAFSAI
jgi:putative endonuclease